MLGRSKRLTALPAISKRENSGCCRRIRLREICGDLSLIQLVRLLGQIVKGSIRYQAHDGRCYEITKMPTDQMLKIRGKEIAMIFRNR